MKIATPDRTDFLESMKIVKNELNALSPYQAFALGQVVGAFRGRLPLPADVLDVVRSLYGRRMRSFAVSG